MSLSVPNFDACFIGLRRSGNHAIIDWLLSHHENWCHYNNPILKDGSYLVPKDQIVRQGDSPDYSLISVEDYDLRLISDYIGDKLRIILLRDPFNLFASRLQMARNFIDNPQSGFTCLDLISSRAFHLWRQYASEFIYEHVKNTAFINFNFWQSDLDYRKTISRALGWKHTDEGFASKRGWQFSGGSSFANKNVLESWRNFEDDEEYLSLFDEQTIFLHKVMFGKVPNLKFSYQINYHEQIDNFLAACYNLIVKGATEQASKIASELQRKYPQSTQVKQLLVALQRGIFNDNQFSG